jgi:transposase
MMGQLQQTLFSDEKIVVTSISQLVNKRKIVFKPYYQDQQFLLPKNIDDFVTPGHIARLISKIIDHMDLQHVIDTYKGGGTSSYNPKMLLKSWILGFANRIYSCRLVAKALRENLPFIWISGNQTPDFRTLNNFRLRLKNEIKKIFREIVIYALERGIIEGKDVFVDHTKNEANANRHKVVWNKQVERQTKMIDEELDELFRHIDEINENEEKIFHDNDLPEQERTGFDDEKVQEIINKINNRVKEKKIPCEQGRDDRKKIRRLQELLERKQLYSEKKKILGERNSYSKTDTDAVAMMMKDKLTIRPAYNEGICVENGLVLNYVISDSPADNISFIPLMDGVIDNLHKIPDNANADSAYGNEENHSYLEEKGIGNFLKYNTYHKEKNASWREKKIKFEDFTYDENKDAFTCKNDVKLLLNRQQEDVTKTGYTRKIKIYSPRKGSCKECPFRARCTKSRDRSLQVSWNAERLKQQAKENLDSEKGLELRKRRGNEVESVFGDEKLNKKKHRYHLRGSTKVNLEAGLYYISHNVRKIHKVLTTNEPTENNFQTKVEQKREAKGYQSLRNAIAI